MMCNDVCKNCNSKYVETKMCSIFAEAIPLYPNFETAENNFSCILIDLKEDEDGKTKKQT